MIVWDEKRGRSWRYPGMAVACPSCNVAPGDDCTGCPEGQHHRFRDEMAEALGFRLAATLPLFVAESNP